MKFGQTQNLSTGDKDRLPTSLRGLGRDRTFKLRRSIKLGRAVACGGGPCPFRFETDAHGRFPTAGGLSVPDLRSRFSFPRIRRCLLELWRPPESWMR